MIRWGIIGVGNIAERFIASLNHSRDGQLMAIASRNPQTRKRFAHLRTYENYQDLLDDIAVDAVYIALPHKFHAEWSIRALKCKKAVLCEKPAALTSNEMEEVIQTAKEYQTFYMEAMKTKFTPAFFKLQEFIESNKLGKIVHIDVNFTSDGAVKGKVQPTSYLFEVGQGGSWNDVSSYLISFVLSFITSFPQKIEGHCCMKDGIDLDIKAKLIFSEGQSADLETAIDHVRPRGARKRNYPCSCFQQNDGF